MEITEKARELGLLMANSKEMEAYKNFEAAMQADVKSTTLMNEYKQLQIELVKKSKENASKDDVNEVKQKLLDKQKEINEYSVTFDFLTAKANLEALMKKVNDIIIFSITGEPTCSDDKCKTCGGGCKG